MKGHLKGLRGKAAAKEADRRARRLDARLGKLDKKLEVARAGLDQQLSAGWRTFEGLRDVLIAAGAPMKQQSMRQAPRTPWPAVACSSRQVACRENDPWRQEDNP